jgi:hypothetical protein
LRRRRRRLFRSIPLPCPPDRERCGGFGRQEALTPRTPISSTRCSARRGPPTPRRSSAFRQART